MHCTAITLSKWDLLEQKRKEEEAARKQASYDDIDGRLVINCNCEKLSLKDGVNVRPIEQQRSFCYVTS